MKTKVCTNCSYEKSAKDFYKDKKNKDRLISWCKACINVYQSLYYQENKEKIARKYKRRLEKLTASKEPKTFRKPKKKGIKN